MALAAPAPVPDGFTALKLRPNPYIDACGPLYGKREGEPGGEHGSERFVLGLRVERRHCNPGGTCHGGMLSTLADMLLVLGSGVQSGLHRYMVTINLSSDFMSAAPEGCWLEGRMQVLRVTRNLVFCQGLLTQGEQTVLRMSGITKPLGDPDPSGTLAAYLGDAPD